MRGVCLQWTTQTDLLRVDLSAIMIGLGLVCFLFSSLRLLFYFHIYYISFFISCVLSSVSSLLIFLSLILFCFLVLFIYFILTHICAQNGLSLWNHFLFNPITQPVVHNIEILVMPCTVQLKVSIVTTRLLVCKFTVHCAT